MAFKVTASVFISFISHVEKYYTHKVDSIGFEGNNELKKE